MGGLARLAHTCWLFWHVTIFIRQGKAKAPTYLLSTSGRLKALHRQVMHIQLLFHFKFGFCVLKKIKLPFRYLLWHRHQKSMHAYPKRFCLALKLCSHLLQRPGACSNSQKKNASLPPLIMSWAMQPWPKQKTACLLACRLSILLSELNVG